MARQNGTWVEYEGGEFSPNMVKVWGSEIKALRSAVTEGNDVVFVEFGETVSDALDREAKARSEAKAKPAPKTTAKPKTSKPTVSDLPTGSEFVGNDAPLAG